MTFANDNSNYFVIWNNEAGNNSTKFTDSRTLSTIYDLHLTGQAIQLSSGQNKDNMYAFAFNNQSLPYYFNKASIGSVYNLQKSSSAVKLYSGRGASITKDSSAFFFMLKSITVDNQNVDFVKAPDTVAINNSTDINKYLVSEPFTLTNTSDFNYVLNYGTSLKNTSIKMTNILAKNNSVSYNLDLVDAENGKNVCTIETIEFNDKALPGLEEQKFRMNLKGLEGSKKCYLKITSDQKRYFKGKWSLIESYSDSNSIVMKKENVKEIDYSDLLTVKDYGLN